MRGCSSTKPLVNIYIEYKGQKIEIGKFCLFCDKVRNVKKSILEKLKLSYYAKFKGIVEISYSGYILSDEDAKINSFGIKENSIINVIVYEDLFEYIEKYNEQLKQLIEMGFDEEEIDIRLLKLCMGKIPDYLRNIEK